MATVKKYNQWVTWNVKGAAAVTEGLFYGIDTSGNAVVADNTTPKAALGFAVKGLTTAQYNNGDAVALCQQGVIEFATSEIAGGAFTVGAAVYLGASGGVTTTKPTTNTYLVQPVGVALTTTKAAINTMNGFIVAQTSGNSNIAI